MSGTTRRQHELLLAVISVFLKRGASGIGLIGGQISASLRRFPAGVSGGLVQKAFARPLLIVRFGLCDAFSQKKPLAAVSLRQAIY